MVGAFRAKYVPQVADGQVLRVCDRFGVVAAAGELARAFGIVPWNEGEAIAAGAKAFTAWLDSRGGLEAGEVLAAVSQVRLFIEQHGEARFEPLDSNGLLITARVGVEAREQGVNGGSRPKLGSQKFALASTRTWLRARSPSEGCWKEPQTGFNVSGRSMVAQRGSMS